MIFSVSINKSEFFGYVVDWCEGGTWVHKNFDTYDQAAEYAKGIMVTEL